MVWGTGLKGTLGPRGLGGCLGVSQMSLSSPEDSQANTQTNGLHRRKGLRQAATCLTREGRQVGEQND